MTDDFICIIKLTVKSFSSESINQSKAICEYPKLQCDIISSKYFIDGFKNKSEFNQMKISIDEFS